MGKLFLIFVTTLIVVIPGSAQSDATDFQVWNETTFVIPVVEGKDRDDKDIDKLSLLVFGNLRLGQNRLFPTDARIGAGFDYRINRHLSFSPTYLYSRSEAQRNDRGYEHRIRFDLHVGNKWKHFSLRDRNRVEYRSRHSNSDAVRYRNRLTLSVPVKIKNKEEFAPFVSNEVYYDFSVKEFTTNEFIAGISRKLTENITADVFYLRRDYRVGDFDHWNGVGLNLKIRLK